MGGGGLSPRWAVHPSRHPAPVPQQRRPGRHGAMLAFLHFLRLLVTALENFMVPLCSKPLAQSYQRGRGRRGAGAMSMPSTPAQQALSLLVQAPIGRIHRHGSQAGAPAEHARGHSPRQRPPGLQEGRVASQHACSAPDQSLMCIQSSPGSGSHPCSLQSVQRAAAAAEAEQPRRTNRWAAFPWIPSHECNGTYLQLGGWRRMAGWATHLPNKVRVATPRQSHGCTAAFCRRTAVGLCTATEPPRILPSLGRWRACQPGVGVQPKRTHAHKHLVQMQHLAAGLAGWHACTVIISQTQMLLCTLKRMQLH